MTKLYYLYRYTGRLNEWLNDEIEYLSNCVVNKCGTVVEVSFSKDKNERLFFIDRKDALKIYWGYGGETLIGECSR